MEIKSVSKIKQAIDLLEEAQDIMNDAVGIEDHEMRGDEDFYAKIQDVISAMEDFFQPYIEEMDHNEGKK
jgi:exoribonuclease II